MQRDVKEFPWDTSNNIYYIACTKTYMYGTDIYIYIFKQVYRHKRV